MKDKTIGWLAVITYFGILGFCIWNIYEGSGFNTTLDYVRFILSVTWIVAMFIGMFLIDVIDNFWPITRKEVFNFLGVVIVAIYLTHLNMCIVLALTIDITSVDNLGLLFVFNPALAFFTVICLDNIGWFGHE